MAINAVFYLIPVGLGLLVGAGLGLVDSKLNSRIKSMLLLSAVTAIIFFFLFDAFVRLFSSIGANSWIYWTLYFLLIVYLIFAVGFTLVL